MRMILPVCLLAAGLVVVGGCDQQAPPADAPSRLTTRVVPYPILLVPGLGGKADVWEASGMIAYLQDHGLGFGGVLSSAEAPAPTTKTDGEDVFALHVNRPQDGLDRWVREIGAAVDTITARTGAPRVVLVGFSTGGVAARAYVVNQPDTHRVARLVTVASPNLGNELAVLARLAGRWKTGDLRVPTPVGNLLQEAVDYAEQETEFDLSWPIFGDLQTPRFNPYLRDLNQHPHPEDVAYVSLTARNDFNEDTFRNLADNLYAVLRYGFEPGRELPPALRDDLLNSLQTLLSGPWIAGTWSGDGVVRLESQSLLNVEFFQDNPHLVETADTVIGSSHQHVLTRHRPLFKALSGAVEIRSIHEERRFWPWSKQVVLDFDHTLAGVSTVEAVALPDGASLPVSAPELLQVGDSVVARVVVGPFNGWRVDRLRVQVTPVAGHRTYTQTIIRGDAPEEAPEDPPLPMPEPMVLTVQEVHDLPAEGPEDGRWDHGGPLFTGPEPDVQLRLSANLTPRGHTPTMTDAVAPLTIDHAFRLHTDPLDTHLRLQVWDEDLAEHDLMGTVTWEPGTLPQGAFEAVTDTGIRLLLESTWSLRPEPVAIGPAMSVR